MALTFLRKHFKKNKKTDKVTLLCDTVIRVSLYLLVFLMPIFFLPYTFEVLEFNKQNLLVVLSLLALVAWLGKIIVKGKVEFRKNILNVPIVVFLVIYALASFFSKDKYLSFIGSWSQESFSFLTVFSFVILYFVIINNLDSIKRLRNLLTVGLISSFIVIMHGLFQMFGKFLLPVSFAQSKFFNLIGTFNTFAVFAAFVLTLAVAYLISLHGIKEHVFERTKPRLVLTFFLWLLGILALLAVILIDFWAAWLSLMIAMIVFLVFTISRSAKLNTRWLMLPMGMLVVSILFLFINLPIDLGLPAEAMPNYQSSWQITKGALQEKALFGSGPGTFIFDYSAYKPESINQTAFWAIRFDRAIAEAMTLLATAGLLGIVSWLLLMGVFIYLVISKFIKSQVDSDWLLGVGLFSSWVLFFITKFLYSSNITLEFLFWFVLSLLTLWALQEVEIKKTSFKTSQKAALTFSFIFILVTTFSVSALYLVGQRYTADVYFKEALALNQQEGGHFADVNLKIRKAIKLNRYEDSYYRILAKIYLDQISNELQKLSSKDAAVKAKASGNIQVLIDAAIKSADKATKLSPNNVANWSMLGKVYQNIISFAKGADNWAVSSYKKAIELEPTNPVLYTELARVYTIKYDLAKRASKAKNADKDALSSEADKDLQKALENLNKAIELKKNYAPAYYQLAMVHVRKGDIKTAISELELNKAANPKDVNASFQLGLLYYQNGQEDKAVIELQRTLALSPNYANAMWYLASIYEKQGHKDKAIELMEKLAKLNPDNKIVKKKLDGLKAGTSAAPAASLPEPVENGAETPAE